VEREFYESTLGFPVVSEWDRGHEDRGVLFQAGPVVIEVLALEDEHQPFAGVGVSLEVPNAKALWHELGGKADTVFPLRHNHWGDTSFCIKDPEGFELTFFTKD